MNERIKQISDQVWEWAENQEYSEPDQFSDIWEAKFAKLIVRECGKWLESEAERLYALSAQESDPIFQSEFELCAEKCYDNAQGLKEHFGVE